MSDTKASTIVKDFDYAAKIEKGSSLEIAQRTGAKRYPGESINIWNITKNTLEAHSFVKLARFSAENNAYEGILPDSEELGLTPLGLGKLAIIESEIPPGKVNKGFKGGIHKVEVYSDAEFIRKGCPCGSKDGSGKAMVGGPYIALANEPLLEWTTGVDYLGGERVMLINETWRCIQEHTSSSENNPHKKAGESFWQYEWEIEKWQRKVKYFLGDIVCCEEDFYLCIQEHGSNNDNKPPNEDFWIHINFVPYVWVMPDG